MSIFSLGFISGGPYLTPRIMATRLGTLAFQLKSFKEPLNSSIHYMSDEIKHQFEVGGDPAWTPLADSTISRKHGDSRILIRTGNLARKAVYLKNWELTTKTASYYLPSDVAYGEFHQKGFSARDGSQVPARPFAVITPKDEDKVYSIFDDWVVERINKVMK